jgi:thioredoxin-disulfide reductase
MIYDLIIIGGGPAGVTAGIYASRNNLKTLLISKTIGGLLGSKAVDIENYPGFSSISGIELGMAFEDHLRKQDNIEIVNQNVVNIQKQDNIFLVEAEDKEYQSKTVIIATGSEPRKLNIEGEKEFLGKGVSYCTTCDGPFFAKKDVAVIGGGNAGFEAAIFLSQIANKVYIMERGETSIADQINQEKVKSLSNVEIINNAITKEIKGDNTVNSLIFNQKGEEQSVNAQGVFVQIGYNPKTDFIKDLVELNERGEIMVNVNQETKTKGLYAVGDITNSNVKQVICACSDGAKAALKAYDFLNL